MDLPDISPELILQAAEGVVFWNKEAEVDDISGFLDLVPDYTRRALKAASLLGIVGEDSATGKFRKVEAAKLFAFCKRLSHPNLFRCHLEQFPPFRHFKSRIMISVEPLQAAREVKSLFNITSDAHLIRDILVNWGTYAGALQRLDGIEISSTSTDFVMDAGPGIIVELYSQQAEIEQYIRKQWSKKTNDFVPNDVVNNLVIGSSKTANEQPFREIILPLGNAFEDYLKHVAGTRTPVIDLAGCNGISQVGERLKSQGVISKKHLGYVNYVGHLRNAGDHSIDTEIGKPWDVRRETLLTLNWVVWSAIESITLFLDGTPTL